MQRLLLWRLWPPTLPKGSISWGGTTAWTPRPFRSRLGNCLDVVWDTRPHHIDEQKRTLLPNSPELKWHIKTCHGFSLGLETSFLHLRVEPLGLPTACPPSCGSPPHPGTLASVNAGPWMLSLLHSLFLFPIF